MTWALAMSPVWAELVSSQTVLQGFLPNGDYVLDIDGQRSPKAEFYMAEQPPALLLVCPELPSAVLLLPGTGSVQTVSAANMTKEADGTVTLNAGSVTEQGKFQVFATWIVFSIDGHGLTLKERPWLLGQQDVSSLERHNPEYAWREKAYTPNPEAIRKLREYPSDVQLTVFFGSWCEFCKQHVPRLMKVVSEIAGSRIRVEFYGLPRAFGSHPVAGPLKIHGVPTGIVYMGSREVGRITGQQWTSPEVALENILPK